MYLCPGTSGKGEGTPPLTVCDPVTLDLRDGWPSSGGLAVFDPECVSCGGTQQLPQIRSESRGWAGCCPRCGASPGLNLASLVSLALVLAAAGEQVPVRQLRWCSPG